MPNSRERRVTESDATSEETERRKEESRRREAEQQIGFEAALQGCRLDYLLHRFGAAHCLVRIEAQDRSFDGGRRLSGSVFVRTAKLFA